MPHHRKSHSEWQQSLCLLCFKKAERQLSERQRYNIDKHILSGLGSPDDRLPTGICTPCRLKVSQAEEEPHKNLSHNLFNYSCIIPPLTIETRQPPEPNRQCTCTMCKIGRGSRVPSQRGRNKDGKFKSAPKKKDSEKTHVVIVNDILKLCKHCLSVIGRGKEHNCSKTSFYKNVNELVDNGPEKSDEKIASKILRNKMHDGTKKITELHLTQEKGLPMNITIGPTKEKCKPISKDDVLKIKTDVGLSSRKMNKIAQHFRMATKQRKLFEPQLKKFIADQHHVLDHLYDVQDIEFDNGVIAPVVMCTDVIALIEDIKSKRCHESEDAISFKVGIDGGGGCLKVCLNVIDEREILHEGTGDCRQSFKCGIAEKRMKTTSVNKLIVIALAPDIPENYENVSKLWSCLHLNSLFNEKENVRIAADLKLCNIIIGLMSHSCQHPCTWCDIAR